MHISSIPNRESPTVKSAGKWVRMLGISLMAIFIVRGLSQLGYTVGDITLIGAILLACVVVYVIPRTAIFGAVLLTGYLGGAVDANLRIGTPLFSNLLFPVYFGILVWAGLVLREHSLRFLFPSREAQ